MVLQLCAAEHMHRTEVITSAAYPNGDFNADQYKDEYVERVK